MRLDIFITIFLCSVYMRMLTKIVKEFFHNSNLFIDGLSGMVIYGLTFLIITNIPRISGKTINSKLAFVILVINGGIFGIIGAHFGLS